MRFRRIISFLLWIEFSILSGCGVEIHREFEQKDPTFSVEAPFVSEALQLTLTDKISDTGEHRPNISMNLKNTRDTSGQAWSELLGDKFFIKIGSQNFELDLLKPNS